MKFLQVIKSLSILFILSVLVSCSSTDGDSFSTSPNATGRVSLLITDAPLLGFDQVNVTIESVSLIGDGEHKVVLLEETQVINLLALQKFSDLLATATVPVGSYSKIRLHVSQVELVRLNPDGTVLSSDIAKLPANGKIDLNPRSSFDVTDNGHLMIQLDMDANKSIHIIGNGKGYNFRPVVFVNILGDDDMKLVILDGKVLEKTADGFQLCEVEAIAVNDDCMPVLFTENTVVQDDLIDVVTESSVNNDDIVTVLGKVGGVHVNALHIVIASDDKQVQNLALFTGETTTAVDINNVFDMKTDSDNNVVSPLTILSVLIADGARIFDKYGLEVSSDKLIIGSSVDVFGLAQPDLATVSKVKAAFVIYDPANKDDDIKLSGTILQINSSDEQITVTVVDEIFSGDVCVDIKNADLFLLKLVDTNISSQEITIKDLQTGMSVDVYGEDVGKNCLAAEVVLVSQ